MKSHNIPADQFLQTAKRLAVNLGERRPPDVQQSITHYTDRIVRTVEYLGFGAEYRAAARLHRVGEFDDITPDYFYRHEGDIPFCVWRAALTVDEWRYESPRALLRGIVADPIARVVMQCEAIINTDTEPVIGTPEGTMGKATAWYIARALEPFLPPIDEPV
jgi:hypothetical protein